MDHPERRNPRDAGPARNAPAPNRPLERPSDHRRADGNPRPQGSWPERAGGGYPQVRSEAPRGPTAVRAKPTPVSTTVAAGSTGGGVRLSKILSDRGVASRREADDWIAAGWVKVNGQMAVLGQRVALDARIDVDPIARSQQAKQVTILLHKPIGYVSGQAEDGYEPAVVLITPDNHWAEDPSRRPFHPGQTRGLAPAGRLDIDSTGLLVLTQDGRIARQLIGDDSDVEKEYLVRVEYSGEGTLPDADLMRLRHGLSLDGQELRPAKVSWANEDQLRFVLREGRKRQIRRMCELVGLKVVGLKRVRIGQIVLGKLPPGQWRYLGEGERF